MDTKLKADIAEAAVTTELLKRGFKVLKSVGDRLPYDLALDINNALIRIQIKHAWFDSGAQCYVVDARRTKTNRRKMLRASYSVTDFDFAILYIDELNVFYVMPVEVFISYRATISLIETSKRQRQPRSAAFRNRWNLLSQWAPRSEMIGEKPVKFGETLVNGNTEPSPQFKLGEGVETRWQAPDFLIKN